MIEMLRKGKKINSTCYLRIVPFVVAQYIISDEVFTQYPYVLVICLFASNPVSALPLFCHESHGLILADFLAGKLASGWFGDGWHTEEMGGSKREDSRVFFPLCSVHQF